MRGLVWLRWSVTTMGLSSILVTTGSWGICTVNPTTILVSGKKRESQMIQTVQRLRDEEGFTLIELLIVIIVLAILAAIVVFAVGSTRSNSVRSSCKTNYKALELSAEGVNTKMGAYPAGGGTAATTTDNIVSGTAAVVGGANAQITTMTTTASGTNAVLSGNLLGPVVNSVTQDNGALLKTWPTSADYELLYVSPAPTVATTPYTPGGSGNTFAIEVYKFNSPGSATATQILVSPDTAITPSANDCDGL